jgi:hypothetical protein
VNHPEFGISSSEEEDPIDGEMVTRKRRSDKRSTLPENRRGIEDKPKRKLDKFTAFSGNLKDIRSLNEQQKSSKTLGERSGKQIPKGRSQKYADTAGGTEDSSPKFVLNGVEVRGEHGSPEMMHRYNPNIMA